MNDLLAALIAERNDTRWWTAPKPTPTWLDDSDIACARHRRELVREFDEKERRAS